MPDEPKTEPIKTLSATMRTEGKNTLGILRGLAQGLVQGLGIVKSAPEAIINQCLAIDIHAADLRSKLDHEHKDAVNSLYKIVTDTDKYIEQLSTVKMTAPLAANLHKLNTEQRTLVIELTDKRAAMYKSAEDFIISLNNAFKSIGDKLEKSPRDPSIKTEVETLTAELKKAIEATRKTFESKKLAEIKALATAIYTDAKGNADANGLTPVSATPKPGTSTSE